MIDSDLYTSLPSEKRQLRRAIKNNKTVAPLWATVLMLSEKWGMPPWTIESEANQYWFERAVAYYDIIGEQASKPTKGRKGTQSTGKTGMEGMTPSGAGGGKIVMDPFADGTLKMPE